MPPDPVNAHIRSKDRPHALRSGIFFTSLLILVSATAGLGQSTDRKNNPYAPSPAGNSSSRGEGLIEIASTKAAAAKPEFWGQPVGYDTSANVTEPARPALTEEYRVGVDDVLFVRLKNAAAGAAHYTVLPDGAIDFPLSGGKINVLGLTLGEIRQKLSRSIKLFRSPDVDVAIREYVSHKVTVSGTVLDPGVKILRRDAVPMYVIKAESITHPDSNIAKVTLENGEMLTYDLKDPRSDHLLIFPGTAIEFGIAAVRPAAFYAVVGSGVSKGDRPLDLGLTLLKAAEAENVGSKRATIRRKKKDGKLVTLKFDLRSIRAGKIADPPIEAGDLVELKD